MYQFFAEEDALFSENIVITGPDVNHIKNVIRLKAGDEIRVSIANHPDYICSIEDLTDGEVKTKIIAKDYDKTELKVKVYLFQGLPKGDKMETVIQKNIELGVHEIIPVAMKRSVVKLDAKKAEAKVKRWNAIAESAAKQSKRSIIPKVNKVMTFEEAAEYSKLCAARLVPYENAKDMAYTREVMNEVAKEPTVAVFIGPEGGFEDDEVKRLTDDGVKCITLGKRILRTETAGMTVMSNIMFLVEE